MKRRTKRFDLHRETLHRLDARDLGQAAGYGPQTSESKPCCGIDPETRPITNAPVLV